MFTSQSLRSVVRPGDLAVREQRLDDVVHQMDLKGSVADANAPELERRIDAALAGGVRWLIVDLGDANPVGDAALRALSTAVTELRSRRGELILAGAPPDVGPRLNEYEVSAAPRPGRQRGPGDHDPQDAAAEDGRRTARRRAPSSASPR